MGGGRIVLCGRQIRSRPWARTCRASLGWPGQALLPGLDNIAKWVSGHEAQIESFAVNAVQFLGTAAQDAGSFIANDLYPPVKDVIGFIVDHKTVFEAFAGTMTALWAGAKIKTAAGSVLGDLKTLLTGNVAGNLLHAITGLGSSSSSGGGVLGAASSAAGQRVFVTNWEMMAGGGGAGSGAVNAAEGAGGGGSIAARRDGRGWRGRRRRGSLRLLQHPDRRAYH